MSRLIECLIVNMEYFFRYLFILIPLVLIDFGWLFLNSKSFYGKHIGHLMAGKVETLPVVLFYLIYSLGLMILVVAPLLSNNPSWMKIFGFGAIFGLVAYSTYDLTNQATLRDWPILVTVVDMVWGSLLTGSVAVIAIWMIKTWR